MGPLFFFLILILMEDPMNFPICFMLHEIEVETVDELLSTESLQVELNDGMVDRVTMDCVRIELLGVAVVHEDDRHSAVPDVLTNDRVLLDRFGDGEIILEFLDVPLNEGTYVLGKGPGCLDHVGQRKDPLSDRKAKLHDLDQVLILDVDVESVFLSIVLVDDFALGGSIPDLLLLLEFIPDSVIVVGIDLVNAKLPCDIEHVVAAVLQDGLHSLDIQIDSDFHCDSLLFFLYQQRFRSWMHRGQSSGTSRLAQVRHW